VWEIVEVVTFGEETDRNVDFFGYYLAKFSRGRKKLPHPLWYVDVNISFLQTVPVCIP
jgi:hypothetical protein